MSSAATAVGPPADGVGCREDPRTVFSPSTTIASILVPPRSIPPRRELPTASMDRILSGPGLSVVLVVGCRLGDRHSERRELERGDLLIDRLRHRLNPRRKLAATRHQMLDTEC